MHEEGSDVRPRRAKKMKKVFGGAALLFAVDGCEVHELHHRSEALA